MVRVTSPDYDKPRTYFLGGVADAGFSQEAASIRTERTAMCGTLPAVGP